MSKHHDVGFVVTIGRTPTPTLRKPSLPVAMAPKAITFVGRPDMHVRIGHPVGIRHRIMLDSIFRTGVRPSITTSTTACGESIAGKYYSPLDESYEGELCKRGCFTEKEIQRAAELHAAEAERRHQEALKFEAEREESARKALAEREARREEQRRIRTGETQPIAKQEPDPDDDR